MARRRPLSALFPTVRARLLAILTVAAIPVFFLVASIMVQSREVVLERTHHRTSVLLRTIAARHDLETADVDHLLRALAASPALAEGAPEGACLAALRNAIQFASPQPLLLAVVGGDRPCHVNGPSRPGMAATGLLQPPVTARPGGTAPEWRLPADAAESDMPILLAALRLRPGDQSPVLVARARADWFAPPGAGGETPIQGIGWLVAADDRLVSLGKTGAEDAGAREIGPREGAAAAGAEPTDAVLAGILRQEHGDIVALSRSGLPYAYSSGVLRGGFRVVVGAPATADVLRADSLLGKRLVELAGVLLLGLVAVAVGAHAAVTRPIKQLTEKVRIWRSGGAFRSAPYADAPREVLELEHTFGEATAALRAREVELREASARQDLLMQEIHHRVKNNLQIVASLLNLQASRIRQPQARAEFQAARDRIRALATLHRHLYAHGELHTINMREFLVELCEQLLQAIGESPPGGRIRLDIQAPELRMTSDRAVPLALIVTEAVSNSVKYAFPDGRRGHIAVRVEQIGRVDPEAPEKVRLLIQDNGVGIPAGRAETETGVRDGIGLQLIRGFARQLGATLQVSEDAGTRYELEVPLHRERHEPESIERESEPA